MAIGSLKAALLGAALVLACGSVAAQLPPPSPAPQPEQQAALPEKEINAFAAAASEIRQLNEKWLPRVRAATQQGAAAEQQVKNQALAEMTQAVERNGLTVSKYNEIYEVTQNNPDVRRKVQERMQPAAKPNGTEDDDDDDDGN